MKYKNNYLITIQFLGFRFSGWQIQPGVKTIQGMIDKTFECIFNHKEFKTLGASRTDAKVSAREFIFQLYTNKPVEIELLDELNKNLPPDIRALNVEKVNSDFNVLNSHLKTYTYFFSNSKTLHPFAAPFMVNIKESLDLKKMQKAALLFQGTHFFGNYCYKPNKKTQLTREILKSEIVENHQLKANFFPEKTYLYRVSAHGFLRHQVRMMMGMLFELGKGKIDQNNFEKTLQEGESCPIFIAPSSGLHLDCINPHIQLG
jgi:tRNA pseudouridine38-40 synthase